MAINQQYPSLLLEKAVGELSKLPGVGRKTALRLALHLLRQNESEVETFSSSILKMKQEIKHCSCCHNVSDTELCPICVDARRDASVVCVVENIQDVMAIENTQQYNGLYHVLHGVLSPMDGIGPEEINIKNLIIRLQKSDEIREVILALNSTPEGESTAMYLGKLIKPSGIKVSRLASGLAVGSDIEYANSITLKRAVQGRISL